MSSVELDPLEEAVEAKDASTVALLWRHKRVMEDLEKREKGERSEAGDLTGEELLLGVVAPTRLLHQMSMTKAEELIEHPFLLRERTCAREGCEEKFYPPKSGPGFNKTYCSDNHRKQAQWADKGYKHRQTPEYKAKVREYRKIRYWREKEARDG